MPRSKNLNRLIAASVGEIPVNEAFLDDLNFCIVKRDTQSRRIPSKSYKPSSLNCIRTMYYQVTGETPDPRSIEASFVGIGESGSARHEYLQSAAAGMAEFVDEYEWVDVAKFCENKPWLTVVAQDNYETLIYDSQRNIRFKCDGLIRYKGKFYILEFKTEMSTKYYGREGVAKEHVNQFSCYGACLGVFDVLVIYENRDTCDKKSFHVHLDQEDTDRVFEHISNCQSYVDNGVVPPVPAEKSSKFCRYCDYKSACRRDGNG